MFTTLCAAALLTVAGLPEACPPEKSADKTVQKQVVVHTAAPQTKKEKQIVVQAQAPKDAKAGTHVIRMKGDDGKEQLVEVHIVTEGDAGACCAEGACCDVEKTIELEVENDGRSDVNVVRLDNEDGVKEIHEHLVLIGDGQAQNLHEHLVALKGDGEYRFVTANVGTNLAFGGPETATVKNSDVQTIVMNQDGQTYKVVVENGKARAWMNGDECKVKADGDAYTLIGEDGQKVVVKVLADVAAPKAPKTPAIAQWRTRGDNQMVVELDPEIRYNVAGEQPRVMVGITMVEPGEEVAQQLEIQPGSAIQIEKVIEGLPAARAGLRSNDIIVRIDGKKPVSVEKLQGILKGKKPGDELNVHVLRKGKPHRFTVDLAPFDGARLGVAAAPKDALLHFTPDGARNVEGLERLQGLLKQGQDGNATYSWTFESPKGQQWIQQGEEAIAPPKGNIFFRSNEGGEGKIDELEARLDKIEARLDRIIAHLEKMGR